MASKSLLDYLNPHLNVFFFQYDHTTVSFQGLNMNKVFYVLDPDGNLENSNQQFRDMFAE